MKKVFYSLRVTGLQGEKSVPFPACSVDCKAKKLFFIPCVLRDCKVKKSQYSFPFVLRDCQVDQSIPFHSFYEAVKCGGGGGGGGVFLFPRYEIVRWEKIFSSVR